MPFENLFKFLVAISNSRLVRLLRAASSAHLRKQESLTSFLRRFTAFFVSSATVFKSWTKAFPHKISASFAAALASPFSLISRRSSMMC